MNEKELYELAISDVPKYSLLNEILAIRDNRFPNEENDYTIKVYGKIFHFESVLHSRAI